MKCIVIGTKELSCVILDELLRQNHEVPLVITRDDEPRMKVWHEMGHRSLKELAIKNGLDVLEGVNINDPSTLDQIRKAEPDIILSCFWSELFKEDLLSIPPRGVYNFHTAYLPMNRGSRPIPWAIIKGEEYAGITCHKMLLGVDDGPIVAQKKVPIGELDTGKSMYDKVLAAGCELASVVIKIFGDHHEVLTPQDDDLATFQLRGEPFGAQFNYFWDSARIDRFKRSLIFPPFRAFRKPPQSFQKASEVALIISSERKRALTNNLATQAQFISDLGQYAAMSGGDAPMRKELRDQIPKGFQLCYFPNQNSGLNDHFPVLESLKRGGYSACISRFETLGGSPEYCQPFRYENGILELAINSINPSQAELTTQINLAKQFSLTHDCKCYLHILLDERYGEEDYELFTGELSQQFQNNPISLMTYGDVCEEFNTEYEDISA